MHDLNTINKLNYEAFAKAIANFQAQGRHVLATYEGLTLVSIETFTDADALVDGHGRALAANPPATGTHFKCFPPTAAFYTAKRDQSEDRHPSVRQFLPVDLADLQPVPTPQDKTLGDYIGRKTAEFTRL